MAYAYITGLATSNYYHRGQNYYKNIFTKKMFWRNKICKNYKRITLQSKFPDLVSCKKGHTSDRKITKKIFWQNYFCNNYKKYYKRKGSKELFCNNFGQDGIERFGVEIIRSMVDNSSNRDRNSPKQEASTKLTRNSFGIRFCSVCDALVRCSSRKSVRSRFPLRDYKIRPTPKIPEKYSKITLWPNPGLS